MSRRRGSWIAFSVACGVSVVGASPIACAQKPAPLRAAQIQTEVEAGDAEAGDPFAPARRLRVPWASELDPDMELGVAPDPSEEAEPRELAALPTDLARAAEALARGEASVALARTEDLKGLDPIRTRRAQVIRATALAEVGRWAEAVALHEALREDKIWRKEFATEILDLYFARALAALAAGQSAAPEGSEARAEAQALNERASGLLGDALSVKLNREGPAMRVERARIQAAMTGEDEKAGYWAAVKAVRTLDGVLRDYPNHPDYGQLRLLRARTLVRAKKYDQAGAAFRSIAIEHAGEPAAELAWREWEALAAAQPKKVDTPEWSWRMRLDAAKHARDARYVEHSAEVLDALMASPDLPEHYFREAQRSRAQTSRRARNWEQCIVDLEKAWERSNNHELRDELSRCYERGERYDELLDLWLEGVAKKSRAQREVALFTGAELAFRAGRYRQARDLIESYEKQFRGHRTERNFMRAMIAEHLGEAGEAIGEFDELARRSDSYREMARYYRAKIRLRSPDAEQRNEGIEELREIVERGWESLTTSGIYGGYPLYYGLQARRRLVEAGVDVAPPPPLEPEPVLPKQHDWDENQARLDRAVAEYGEVSEALVRAQQLYAVGELERARRELRVAVDELMIGVARVRGGSYRSPRSEELEQGLGWRATWKLPKPRISKEGRALIRDKERLDAYEKTLRELSIALDEPYRAARLGEYSQPYRQRYFRRAYAPTVEHYAEMRGMDATHLWALMYTESRFRRHVVSGVGARGALQIMPWTGRQLLQRLGEFDGHFDPDTLFDIETNARLASYYVAELLANFHGQPAFVYASYNGGPSNVARWLEAKGNAVLTRPLGLDDFIEEIPFTETHRYTKRVMETQAAYMWMYEGVLPEWSNAVDAKVEHTIEF